MATTKSENFWASASVGATTRWIHIDAGNTGRIKIAPRAGNRIVLCNVVVNTSGASGTTILSDSKNGVIASLKASVQEKDYHYQLPVSWNSSLYIDNTSGSDLTIMFINY